jgi:hypothetical protein
MFSLPVYKWVRLAVWRILGLIFYSAYGHRRSALRNDADVPGAIRNATN